MDFDNGHEMETVTQKAESQMSPEQLAFALTQDINVLEGALFRQFQAHPGEVPSDVLTALKNAIDNARQLSNLLSLAAECEAHYRDRAAAK